MTKLTVFSLLAVLLVGACGGAGASPSPGARPTPDQSPVPTPGGTPGPSETPAPTGAPSPGPTVPPGGIDHPTGPDDIVLQYGVSGGLMTPDMVVTEMPHFTLYGDGTVIWRPREDSDRVGGDGLGLPRLLRGTMSEDAVQALLAFALGQGRVAGARGHYPQNACADCPLTTFQINADGMSKTVTIDALGIEDRMDPVDRAGFQQLAEWLANFDEQARNGVAGEVVLYDPSRYRVVLTEAMPEAGEFEPWPWPDVAVEDFTPRGEGGWQREAYLAREQVAMITEVPSGGTLNILVEDPAGGLWSLALRPLLPDEIAALGE